MANYHVEVIFFNRRPNCALGVRKSSYFKGKGGGEDKFTFKRNGFSIEAKRKSIYVDGKILNNSQNSLKKQIFKGLLVYYALAPDFPELKSISIIRKRQKRFGDVIYTETIDIKQPLTQRIDRNHYLSQRHIDGFLVETDSGDAKRTALSYWLKGINSQDLYFKFDRYWKAFDRLLLHQGNTNKERDGICEMKKLIRTNVGCFIKSVALTNTFTDADIRRFSWNKLLYKYSKKYTKPEEIKRRATEYIDSRAIRLFKSLVNGPKVAAALTNAGLMANVTKHFKGNATKVCDIDIVLLMSLSYTYYMRCKLFHGEVPDSTFKVKATNEDWEIEKLNSILEIVVFELLEHNHILR